MMESANRDEAERCLRRAKSTRDMEKARRWAEKSFRLFPAPECRGGFARAQKMAGHSMDTSFLSVLVCDVGAISPTKF